MGATNRTSNYGFPQFISTDIPSWLGDVNGALSSIDSTIHDVDEKATTSNTNSANAISVANDASTNANTALNNAQSALSTANEVSNTANSASSTANSALATANTANTTANNAVNVANSAISTANSTQSSVTNLTDEVTNVKSDVSENASNITSLQNDIAKKENATKTLFEDSSFSTGNTSITLSESAANFDYLDIYYRDNDGYRNCHRVLSPNGAIASLYTIVFNSASTGLIVKSGRISISGTSITMSRIAQYSYTGSSGSFATGSNFCSIIRVEGGNFN